MNIKQRKFPFKKILLIVFILLLTLTLSVGGYFVYQLSKLKQGNINIDNIGLSSVVMDTISNKYKHYDDVTNIALFGVDSRDYKQGDVSHSDSMMILTIDRKHNKIKLSSILRDSLVKVDGHGETKLTHAYSYGGPELTIKTLNQNFNLNIENYITVDFSGLTEIINTLGGVDIFVKENEISQINKYGKEVSQIMGETYMPIEKSGLQTLNGHQATAYARIRKVGNGDFDRAVRQKTVLLELSKKIQNQGVLKYPSLISRLVPYTETSLSTKDILGIGTNCITSGITTIDWYRFPIDGYCDKLIKNNEWYLWLDIPETTKQLHEFIYEDIKSTPLDPKF
ncbi:MAG: LCP family protein [Clostridium sp.]